MIYSHALHLLPYFSLQSSQLEPSTPSLCDNLQTVFILMVSVTTFVNYKTTRLAYHWSLKHQKRGNCIRDYLSGPDCSISGQTNLKWLAQIIWAVKGRRSEHTPTVDYDDLNVVLGTMRRHISKMPTARSRRATS